MKKKNPFGIGPSGTKPAGGMHIQIQYDRMNIDALHLKILSLQVVSRIWRATYPVKPTARSLLSKKFCSEETLTLLTE